MRIATWNINGVRAREGALKQFLKEYQPDILCLQEIKTVDEGFPVAEVEGMGYNVATHGQKSWNGVAILSKMPADEITRGLPGDDSDEQARLIEGVFSVEGGAIRVCNIYLPNGNPVESEKFPYKLGWMTRLEAFIRSRLTREDPFLVIGDFNLIPTGHDCHDPKAWWGDALFRAESLEKFRRIVNLGLTDTLRATTRDQSFTFWDFQAGAWRRNAGIRIDHILASPQAADLLRGVEVHRDVRGWDKPSDHVPVVAEFAVAPASLQAA